MPKAKEKKEGIELTDKQKHAGGRPPIFNSVIDLQKKVDEYFDLIAGEWVEPDQSGEEGYWKILPQNATVTGLSLYLGFNSRQSLLNYEAKDEFLDIIKKAKTKVEQGYENHLFSKTPAGAIFALKNMGWSDKKELEHSGKDGQPLVVTGMTIKP